MDYFPHDTMAMSDDKLLALRIDSGLEAVACYWAVLEKIYADERPFDMSGTNVEATSVLLRLGVGFETLEKYVSRMVEIGLLKRDVENPKSLMSERAEKQIEELQKKREIARQNGKAHKPKPKKQKSKNQPRTYLGSNDGTEVGTNKTLNVIGLDKPNLITYASGDADAQGAPPAALECPKCDASMRRTNSHKPTGEVLHRCDRCGEEVWS